MIVYCQSDYQEYLSDLSRVSRHAAGHTIEKAVELPNAFLVVLEIPKLKVLILKNTLRMELPSLRTSQFW